MKLKIGNNPISCSILYIFLKKVISICIYIIRRVLRKICRVLKTGSYLKSQLEGLGLIIYFLWTIMSINIFTDRIFISFVVLCSYKNKDVTVVKCANFSRNDLYSLVTLPFR